ncbi:MAG: hypothetical protein RRZ84_06030 [Romboutsia sp.]
MNKLAVTVILIATTLLSTACDSNYKSSSSSVISSSQDTQILDPSIETKEAVGKIINMPIEILSKEEKQVKYVQIKEDSSLQEKIDSIVKTISEECFNGLTIKATIYRNNSATVELKELDDIKASRATWKDDYLNSQNREQTINIIVKNMLQEEYKGAWIKTVQLYYEGELITLN